MRRPALAHVVLAHGETDAAQHGRALVAGVGLVGEACEPQRHRQGGLGLDLEIGDDVAHERLIDERLAERRTVRDVVGGALDALRHDRRAADHAVEARHVDHLDDGADPAALVAEAVGDGVLVLDLAARVGVVAELVLEALDADRVTRPVLEHARHDEARHAAGRLGEREEDVRHRRRREPLVAHEAVGAVGLGRGARRVGAHVGAALLLRHRHSGDDSGLRRRVGEVRVVAAGREQRRVARGQFLVGAQCGDGGVRHRDRAAVPGVGGDPGRVLRRAHEVRVRVVAGPRRPVEAEARRVLHERVVGRVVLDLVDAVAEAVVRVQPRHVALGEVAPAQCLTRTGERTDLVEFGERLARIRPFERFAQHGVGPRVVVLERRGLVEHLMGLHGLSSFGSGGGVGVGA